MPTHIEELQQINVLPVDVANEHDWRAELQERLLLRNNLLCPSGVNSRRKMVSHILEKFTDHSRKFYGDSVNFTEIPVKYEDFRFLVTA